MHDCLVTWCKFSTQTETREALVLPPHHPATSGGGGAGAESSQLLERWWERQPRLEHPGWEEDWAVWEGVVLQALGPAPLHPWDFTGAARTDSASPGIQTGLPTRAYTSLLGPWTLSISQTLIAGFNMAHWVRILGQEPGLVRTGLWLYIGLWLDLVLWLHLDPWWDFDLWLDLELSPDLVLWPEHGLS